MNKNVSHEHNKDASPSIFSKILKVVAYPVSILIGLSFWHTGVRKTSMERLRTTGSEPGGVFADLLKARIEKQDDLLKQAINPENFPAKLKIINQEFSAGQAERMSELGFTNIFKKYKSISRFSRFETALTGLTAAGVALGIILTMADSKFLLKKMDTEEDKSATR